LKTLIAILILCHLAGEFLVEANGSSEVTTPELVWTAKTNDWPSSLWVYRVVPQNFSPAVISNLLTMASFSLEQNQSVPGKPGYEKDKVPPLYFSTPNDKRHLGIAPSFGYIEYRDYGAEAEPENFSVGVPTDEETYPIALEYLRKFGVDRSQLATKPSTNKFTGPLDLGIRRELRTQSWTDKSTHKPIEDVYRRGIYFVRRLDGVDIDGIVHGGVFISFGNHARIAELSITWRGLEPHELRRTLAPPQVLDLIRSGRAKWRPALPVGPISRITVYGFEPFYRGQPGNVDLEAQQRFVEPYVMIYATLGDGGTNDVKCFSEMPIFPPK